MSRLTEREIEEIRRVKRAVRDEAREEFSQVRLADDANTRQPALAARILGLLAQYSGLAEIAWLVRHKAVPSVLQRVQARRAVAELRALNDRALRDIGIERGQIETVVEAMKDAPAPAPRPMVGPLAALQRWIVRRRTIDLLSALDDRLLEDIGLVRAHIADFVHDMDAAVLSGRIEGVTAAQRLRKADNALDSQQQWNLSRQAAGDLARLDSDAVADLGYVQGDIDRVPEASAERKLTAA